MVNLEDPKAAPREKDVKYRKHSIHLVYQPLRKRWLWSFTFTSTTELNGHHPDLNEAIAQAKKRVDMVADNLG